MTTVTPRLLVALSLATSVFATSASFQVSLADQPAAPSLPASDDDFDNVASVENVDVEVLDPRALRDRNRNPEGDPAYFEGIVFGAQGAESIEAVRMKLGFMMQIKIEVVDLACGLDSRQRRRLRVAGEGDIKRLFDRIDELKGKWRFEQGAIPPASVREAIELRNTIALSPFSGGNSLFARTLDRFLSTEQRARCTELGGTEKLGASIRIRVWPNAADKIKEIWLSETTFGNDGLERLENMISLQKLHLDSTRITDAGLVHLAQLSNLEELDLESTGIDGAGLVHFRALQRLKALNLSQTQATDESLAHLRGLTSLTTLKLDNSRITSRGMANLRLLTQLEALSLCETQVADAGLAELSTLKKLRELDLGATQVTDAGLVHLAALTNLHVLDLRRTRVSDAGLAHLERLTNVKYVYLYGTPVTEAGIANLKRSLPGTRVIQ